MCLAMRAGWLIARYRPNGKLDKSFGRRGTKLISGITKSWTENGFLSSIADIAVQRNGKIAILGRTEYLANGLMASNEISRLLIYRLRRDGSIDSSFGTKGRVLKRISSKRTNFIPIRLAITADGKYLAAGSAWRRDDKTDEDVGYFAATRLTSSGRIDATYGTSGFRLYKLGDLGGSTRDAEFFSDGSVAFAGSRYLKPADDDPRPAAATLAKFDAAGDLDANFGTSGELDLTTTLGPGYTGFEESILATRSGGVIGFVRKGEGPLEYVAAGFGPYASRLPLTLGRMNLNGVSIVRAFESERGIVIAGDYATSNRARIFLGSIVP
jgi:uncharacterized delta-60 repeat protein